MPVDLGSCLGCCSGSCGHCQVVPAAWVIYDGKEFANGTCQNCDVLNSDLTLVNVAPCDWQIHNVQVCDDGFGTGYDFGYDPVGNQWVLILFTVIGGGAPDRTAVWSIPDAQFNCLGINFLTIVTRDLPRCIYPNTMVVQPA